VPVISEFKPPNLLTDGGLNLWTTATNLTHWTESISGSSTVNRESSIKNEGDYSVRLYVDAGNSNVYIYQDPSLTPLKRYKVIVYYKNSVVGKECRVHFKDAGDNVYLKEDGTWNVGSYDIILPNSTVWAKIEIEFNAHADYSNYRLYLMRYDSASSSIYFDNISIEELKPSLINPSVGWHFDGINDYVDCGNNTNLDIGTEDKTFALWFKTTMATTAYMLSDQVAVPAKQGYQLEMRGGNFGVFVFDNGVTIVNKPNLKVANDDKWHMGVLTLDRDGNAVIYFDAVLAGTADISAYEADDLTSSEDTTIGSPNFFNGYIALPFIANKAWSAAQVSNFYNATKGMFAPRG